MYRNAENKITIWFNKIRRKPLVIRGARQVGKSTLVKNFAAKKNITLYEINLERYPRLNKTFSTFNIKAILRELSAILKKDIVSENSILFLDEIQAAPNAIQALRYFYEDLPQLPVIAAGSLLEFTLADHSFSMPVGRIEYLHMWPMSFSEFLIAKNEHYLIDILDKHDLSEELTDSTHNQLLSIQREYIITGGMPEAVLAYVENGQMESVHEIHDSILATYQDDFAKYAKKNELMRLHTVFNYGARAVGRKVKYTNISRDDQARDIKQAIALLNHARVITKIYHSASSGVPLDADININIYKLLFLDIGLMNRICGTDWSEISKLTDQKLINEGAIAEQFIGQHLLLTGTQYGTPSLCYWLREEKSANAEVDFVISKGKRVFPVEVKAGKSGALKSLLQFVHSKKTPLAIRFDQNKPSFQHITHSLKQKKSVAAVNFNLLSLPIYMVEHVSRLIETVNNGKK